MRINEFNEAARPENESVFTDEQMKQVAETIMVACGPWLDEVGLPVAMFRGIDAWVSSSKNAFITKRVRLTDRQTLAMPTHLHKAANEYFTQEFGEPFRNSAMSTGDPNEAAGFGEPFIVFPIGKYSYCWSPKVDDLNFVINEDMEQPNRLQLFPRGGTSAEEQNDLKINILPKLKYQNNNLARALDSGNEIMLRCERYYALSYRQVQRFGLDEFNGLFDL